MCDWNKVCIEQVDTFVQHFELSQGYWTTLQKAKWASDRKRPLQLKKKKKAVTAAVVLRKIPESTSTEMRPSKNAVDSETKPITWRYGLKSTTAPIWCCYRLAVVVALRLLCWTFKRSLRRHFFSARCGRNGRRWFVIPRKRLISPTPLGSVMALAVLTLKGSTLTPDAKIRTLSCSLRTRTCHCESPCLLQTWQPTLLPLIMSCLCCSPNPSDTDHLSWPETCFGKYYCAKQMVVAVSAVWGYKTGRVFGQPDLPKSNIGFKFVTGLGSGKLASGVFSWWQRVILLHHRFCFNCVRPVQISPHPPGTFQEQGLAKCFTQAKSTQHRLRNKT